ncbi:MAG: hypothetical protein PVG86_01620 [Desulfobacterales bacterium]
MDTLLYKLLEESVGIPIEIISNEFKEIASNTYHRIVFQIKEEEPDLWAFGVLFALSLMSFSFAAPRGISEMYFIPDEEWNLGYFVKGLEFENKCLCFSSDYVSGRLMKTDIVFESGGRVTLTTRNRGRGAERWVTHLQGKKHIQPLKNE